MVDRVRSTTRSAELARGAVRRLPCDASWKRAWLLSVRYGQALPRDNAAYHDAALGGQFLVQAGAGERCGDGEARQIDLRLDREARGLEEHLRRVVVQSEHEAPLQGDAPLVQALDDFAVARRVVEALVVVPQV